MITSTLIQGLDSKRVQARLDSADAKPFLFGTYFPVLKKIGFSWKTVTNAMANVNVAADIHSDNSSTVRKSRPVFAVAQGDIPLISISREMTRAQIKEYQTALALASDADAKELVQYWGEDVDFCFNGVQSELEYIAWALISNACSLNFTTTNNATFANEYALDYQVDEANKVKTGSDWNNTSADVIGDLAKIIAGARQRGLNPKYAFVSLETFYKISSAEQIIKACSTTLANAVGAAMSPDLTTLNQMLAKQAWLNGLQLRVIDQTITRELADHTVTSANPFAVDRMVLAEKATLGTTQYDVLAENTPGVVYANRAHTVIKKYGTAEPLSEVTIGQADAMPVVDTAYRNVYVKTDATEW